jgi:integrase
MVFRFANEILDCKIKYLRPLKPPEKRLIRQWRVARGPMMYSAAEIRTLIDCADPHLKAAILLGINAGFGPGDCFALTPDHIRDNFVDFPRPKTAIQRRCPLWPETLEAITAIAEGERVFGQKSTLRRPRRKWNRHMLGNDFQELCKACSITCRGLYSLRRTFETIAKNAPVNQSCIDRIMGHERPDMSELYSQRTFDKQLLVCTNFVKRWLDGKVTL